MVEEVSGPNWASMRRKSDNFGLDCDDVQRQRGLKRGGIDVAEWRDGVHRSAAANDARGHHKRPSAKPQNERWYASLWMLDALNG